MSKLKDVVLSRVVLLTIVIVTLIFTALGVFFNLDYQSYTFKEDSICFYNDVPNIVPKGTKATKNKDGIILKDGDTELFKADTSPVFSQVEYKLVVMEDIGYYCLEDGVFSDYKLSYFTEVYIDNDNVYAFKNDVKKIMSSGFIYDGENNYIFLEDAKISLGHNIISINALSYVEYDDNKVYVYSFLSETLDTYNVSGDVVATCNGYTISLSNSVCKIAGDEFILDNYFGDLKNYLNK